ncbi:hypothetical protein [Streptomyces sp. 11x1]|uniref:hypothetical protein n=1 Tax=Streptomyces sp. 11x1 TaxID=3038642 RepID=UPI002931B3A9|nr:hypothetical protein [Streptomyces sp. 11x1]WNZ14761.1 hypothetical protein P8T65_40095 [Streptomyces sp. 11x1]
MAGTRTGHCLPLARRAERGPDHPHRGRRNGRTRRRLPPHRCLGLHDHHTRLGEEVPHNYGPDALEVADEVYSSSASIVFDQAENRLHTIKAVLVATLED